MLYKTEDYLRLSFKKEYKLGSNHSTKNPKLYKSKSKAASS
jgi:hypothetical protein